MEHESTLEAIREADESLAIAQDSITKARARLAAHRRAYEERDRVPKRK